MLNNSPRSTAAEPGATGNELPGIVRSAAEVWAELLVALVQAGKASPVVLSPAEPRVQLAETAGFALVAPDGTYHVVDGNGAKRRAAIGAPLSFERAAHLCLVGGWRGLARKDVDGTLVPWFPAEAEPLTVAPAAGSVTTGEPGMPPAELAPPLTPAEKASRLKQLDADLPALAELRGLGKRWVVWREVWPARRRKATKRPFTAMGRAASSTSPRGWATFEACRARFEHGHFHGMGIMLAKSRVLGEAAIVGIDLDDCVTSEGGISPVAATIYGRIRSYTEVSPSGRGLRILLKCTLPPGVNGRRNPKLGIECYAAERFLTVTGDKLADSVDEIVEDQEAFEWFWHSYIPARVESSEAPDYADLAGNHAVANIADFPDGKHLFLWDEQLIETYRATWTVRRGFVKADGVTPDPSAYDQSLANAWKLFDWTLAEVAAGLLKFRTLHGFEPEKLFRNRTYIRRTYAKATAYAKAEHAKLAPLATAIGDTAARAEEPGEATEPPPHGQADSHAGGQRDQGTAWAQLKPPPPPEPPWPEPLAEDAFHGIAGEVVRLIMPQTEADPAALLFQFLAAAGNVMGNGSYAVAEADKHPPRLNTVIVGRTSKGRKGTSWGRIQALLAECAPDWEKCVASGLSSGEGLIFQVRDPVEGKPDKKGNLVGGDEGVADKRLFVVEPEFARALAVMERAGNTLSAVVRTAWDHGDLRTLTKVSPTRATGAHIGINAHVTFDELRRLLTQTEAANGFGNRFLYVCAQRSKLLPRGGQAIEWGGVKAKLAKVLRQRPVGEMGRTEAAWLIWEEAYPGLSEGRPGLLGALLGRAEAQVLRLAETYARLDRAREIGAPHKLAALACWRYSEASALFIFGDTIGDPLADEILRALRAAPAGMTRTDLMHLFARHRTSEEISRALGVLLRERLAASTVEKTGGRPAERWRAV